LTRYYSKNKPGIADIKPIFPAIFFLIHPVVVAILPLINLWFPGPGQAVILAVDWKNFDPGKKPTL
jgi:hypothetical protein